MSLKRVWDHLEDDLEAKYPPRSDLQALRDFTAGNDSFDLDPARGAQGLPRQGDRHRRATAPVAGRTAGLFAHRHHAPGRPARAVGLRDVKGVFYLNVVDEVTQWESVMAVPALTRQFVQPLLRLVLSQTFPFGILGLHADNGSEFINHATAGRGGTFQALSTGLVPRENPEHLPIRKAKFLPISSCFHRKGGAKTFASEQQAILIAKPITSHNEYYVKF